MALAHIRGPFQVSFQASSEPGAHAPARTGWRRSAVSSAGVVEICRRQQSNDFGVPCAGVHGDAGFGTGRLCSALGGAQPAAALLLQCRGRWARVRAGLSISSRRSQPFAVRLRTGASPPTERVRPPPSEYVNLSVIAWLDLESQRPLFICAPVPRPARTPVSSLAALHACGSAARGFAALAHVLRLIRCRA